MLLRALGLERGGGILLARRNNFDVIGIFSVAFILSFGGGTLRDLVLDRHPLFWIENTHYPIIVFLLAIGGKTSTALSISVRDYHNYDVRGNFYVWLGRLF